MAVLENCEPKRVFHYFEEICKIPHGSGNTKQISDYLVQFAKDHDLKYVQDEMNNVVIYKPGTAGYENAPVVIIQGHMDMVCEKTPDCDKNMDEDDYIRLMTNQHYQCPYYRNGDDYLVVRKQLQNHRKSKEV